MGYYQGDFYRGTRGDPGFFSFLGKIAKTGFGLVKGALGGGEMGGGGVMPGGSPGLSRVSAAGTAMVRRGVGTLMKHPVLSAAGAAGAVGLGGELIGRRRGMAAGRAAAMGGLRRRRRMHVTNVKALRRAIRRAQGFSKLARRVLHFTHPRAARGRPVFRIRKRKRTV